MIKTTSTLAIAALGLLLSEQTQAQTFGIAQTPNGTGATYSTKEINVETSPNATYTVYATYPTDTTAYSHIRWYVYGGIEKVSESATHLTFRSASGTTYNDKYSKYAYGQVQLSATLSDQTVADCECATMCNPTRTANLFVYKRFDFSANHIIGPDCVLPGDSVTFSVEPWLTLYPTLQLDTAAYFWDIPIALQASPLYYSSDKSSVTFVVSDSIENKTIKCSIGRLNYADGQLPIEKTLSNDVADPIITLGGVPFDPETHSVCLPFGVDSVDLVVTNASPELEYSWNLRAWDYRPFTNNGSLNRVAPLRNAQNITLSVLNGCSDKQYYYNINRTLTEGYNQIVTKADLDTTNCLSGSSVELTILNADDQSSFVWSVSSTDSNWQLTKKNGQVSNMLQIGNGSAVVSVYSAECGGTVLQKTFYAAPYGLGYISGAVCIAPNDSVTELTYSITASRATTFEWQFPSSWTLLGSDTLSTIHLRSDGMYADTIKVRALGCKSTAWSTILPQITYAPSGFTHTCVNVDTAGIATFTAIDNPNKTTSSYYRWNIPNALTGYSGSGNFTTSSKQISVATKGDIGVYPITISYLYSCENGTTYVSATDSVIIEPATLLEMTTNTSRIKTIGFDEDYYYSTPEETTKIRWYFQSFDDAGLYAENDYYEVNIVKGTVGNDNFTVGTVWCVIDIAGCKTVLSFSWDDNVGGNKSLSISSNEEENEDPLSATVTPNPASDVLYVELSKEYEHQHVRLIDPNGKSILRKNFSGRNATIDISSIPNGMYVVEVSGDGQKIATKQLIRR